MHAKNFLYIIYYFEKSFLVLVKIKKLKSDVCPELYLVSAALFGDVSTSNRCSGEEEACFSVSGTCKD